MILFVFEGKRESVFFKALKSAYFSKDVDHLVSVYEGNIYDLYHTYKRYDGDVDIVSLIRERCKQYPSLKNPFSDEIKTSDFAEVFLFFDYDFHHGEQPLDQLNSQLNEMLNFFNNETENGKLYISYPMVEAIRYTKELPDENYHTYEINREQSKSFKKMAAEFSFYKNTKFLNVSERLTTDEKEAIKQNWEHIKIQNIKKANWICNDALTIPTKKDANFQHLLFNAQVNKFVTPKKAVSILSSFALFLFDYFS